MRLSLLQIIMVISNQYTVTGLGVTTDGSVAPDTTDVNGTVGGQSYTWTGLDLSTENKPEFNQIPVLATLFNLQKAIVASSGISNVTTIQRNIESQSVVTSTSVFSQ